MSEFTTTPILPTIWLRRYSKLSKWLLWAVLGLWCLLFLLWLTIYLLIAPNVNYLRPLIEELASSALGQTLSIGEIKANTTGWTPSLEMSDVVLINSSNQQTLSFKKLHAFVTPTALLKGGFSRIIIENPDFDIRRTTAGLIEIAGIQLSANQSDEAFGDWVFSQSEWMISDATIRWIDLENQKQPVIFEHINTRLVNGLRSHSFRIEATPPREWGTRFRVTGRFQQPLLSTHESRIRDWQGKMLTEFNQIHLSPVIDGLLAPGNKLQINGSGWMRAWLDFKPGSLSQAIIDTEIDQVALEHESLSHKIDWYKLQGRIHFKPWLDGYQVSLDKFNLLENFDSKPKILNDFRYSWSSSKNEAEFGKIELQDLQKLIPLVNYADNNWLEGLTQFQLSGQLQHFHANWQGGIFSPKDYTVSASFFDTSLREIGSKNNLKPANPIALNHIPRWDHLSGSIKLSPNQIESNIQINKGHILWPYLSEDESFDMDLLSAQMSWHKNGENQEFDLTQGIIKSKAVSGDLRLSWSKNDASNKLGFLDLNATISHADGRSVYKFLPKSELPELRDYLQNAIASGEVNKGKISLHGNLDQFPFLSKKEGQFSIAANIEHAKYDTAPSAVMSKLRIKPTSGWPVLQDLSGKLLIEQNSFSLTGVKAQLNGANAIQWNNLEANIPNLGKSALEVKAEGKGPLPDALRWFKASAVNELIDHPIDKSQAQGLAEYKVKLSLPIGSADKFMLQGSVSFLGNEILIGPSIPPLSKTRGILNFSDSGFVLQNIQARILGSEAKIEGGLKLPSNPRNEPDLAIKIQGVATAEGIRSGEDFNPDFARLGNLIEGSANYSCQITWRNDYPEIDFLSNLIGMQIKAPAGFNKTPEQSLPLHVSLTPVGVSGKSKPGLVEDELQIQLGQMMRATIRRTVSAGSGRLGRGTVQLGKFSQVNLPDSGIHLVANLGKIDVNEWDRLISNLTKTNSNNASNLLANDFLPSHFKIYADELTQDNRILHRFNLDGSHLNNAWVGNISAQELEGSGEFRPASANSTARLYARLSFLNIPPAATNHFDGLLSTEPVSIPALDVVINSLEIKGKKLGRANIEAINQTSADGGREWLLNKFNLSSEDASFNAKGVWRAPTSNAAKITNLDFQLDIHDSGALLDRMGMPNTIRAGKGKVTGNLNWQGSPITPDFPSLNGNFNIQVEKGQFLKSEPGAARLLGVLSLQSLPRRLMLDFRDVFSDGFAFDYFRGDVGIHQGIASSGNLQMKGVNAAVLMDGKADIVQETQDIKVLVIPDINAGGASLLYSAINPVIGLSTFLAQYVFRGSLNSASTEEFHIEGSWNEPKINKIEKSSDFKQ